MTIAPANPFALLPVTATLPQISFHDNQQLLRLDESLFPSHLNPMEAQPHCAICGKQANPECSCENDRLKLALQQAEQRAMEAQMQEIRTWVLENARRNVVHTFNVTAQARKAARDRQLHAIPFYTLFLQYSGHPPISQYDLYHLRHNIKAVQQRFQAEINLDWRNTVQRYPEILDYFYSLVTLTLPEDTNRAVTHPTFGRPPPQIQRRPSSRRRHSGGRLAPPVAPTVDSLGYEYGP